MSLIEICPSMTQAQKLVANILKEIKDGEIITDKKIIEVIKHHPIKKIDSNNLDLVKMGLDPHFKKPAVFFKYKDSDEYIIISWIDCIRNLYGKYIRYEKYEKKVNKAFRNEAYNGTHKQYFTDNTTIKDDIRIGICDNCNKKTENITTDHYKLPYKEIFDNFKSINNIISSDIDIFENGNLIRIKDENLASRWLNYHDSRAQYRMLCRPCNSHFGSYGY